MEEQFPVPRNTAASKIGNGVISLLWQLRCHCNPGHNKFSSLSNTTVVLIFPNLCLWRRSLRSNVGGVDPEKLYRVTLRWFVLFPPSLGAKSERKSSALMSPFWLIFLSFFRLWPFQSGKRKRLEMLRIKKILFAVVFIAMWQGKKIFLYDICSNFCHLATVEKDWCAWQLSGAIFWLLSWGHINVITGTKCKGL